MQSILSGPVILTILIISLICSGFSVYTLISVIKLNKLKTIFFHSKNGQDLELAIHSLMENQKVLGDKQTQTEQHLAKLDHQADSATQKVGLVRFNPFDDGGGNFSFSLALLDAYQNGVVITSLHGRQQNRIYTKKITLGKSESDLTQEETEAITQANK